MWKASDHEWSGPTTPSKSMNFRRSLRSKWQRLQQLQLQQMLWHPRSCGKDVTWAWRGWKWLNGIKWSMHGLKCLTWPFHQHIAQDWTLCLLRPLSIAVWNPAGALSLADIRRRSCRSQRLRGWEWCNLKMNLYESMNQLENMEKLIAYP